MKINCLSCCVVVGLLLAGGCGRAQTGQMKQKEALSGAQRAQKLDTTISKRVACDYLLYLPVGYGEKEQVWPLMMFLHGAGERGSDLNKVKVHGPPKLVEAGKDLPFIIVSPQCPEGDWWTDKNEVLITLLDDIAGRYDVDTERIYLTGLSMGGYGTWALAAAHSERFAAIVPICGGGKRFMAWRLKDVPVWAFHGARDNLVPVSESEEIVNALKAQGAEAKLTVYPEAGHDSWTETYNNPELYDWLLRHRRGGKER